MSRIDNAIGELFVPESLRSAAASEQRRFQDAGGLRRLWQRDKSLWTGTDEDRWLGWLDLPDATVVDDIRAFGEAVRERGFRKVLLAGMGGSSLGAEVVGAVLGDAADDGSPELTVLDTTDPATIASALDRVGNDLALGLIASKSGSTLETALLGELFVDRFGAENCVAITDPLSALERQAADRGFWRCFAGEPTIGGRFSVLSPFGLVPAAAAGIAPQILLDPARQIAERCRSTSSNPGVELGCLLAAAVASGRDKLSIVGVGDWHLFGVWLEQLIAESTGKDGTGIVPVDREPNRGAVGADRLFVVIGVDSDIRPVCDELRGTDQPYVAQEVRSGGDLGGVFFSWEVATAVVGWSLQVNPFVQPDVELAKVMTRKLTEQLEQTGELELGDLIASSEGVSVFLPGLSDAGSGAHQPVETSVASALTDFLADLRPPDYFAILAYLPLEERIDERLQAIRSDIGRGQGVAVSLGYGPRYLHSTGQAHKGGPPQGRFLVLTRTTNDPLAVPDGSERHPGMRFADVQLAQALGDAAALAERGKRVIRVHLQDPESGLERLSELLAR